MVEHIEWSVSLALLQTLCLCQNWVDFVAVIFSWAQWAGALQDLPFLLALGFAAARTAGTVLVGKMGQCVQGWVKNWAAASVPF